jgi:hypothetical protein
MPIKKLDKDKEILDTVVPRLLAMSGNPGRYISIENGPTAVSKPKVSRSINLFFRGILVKIISKN